SCISALISFWNTSRANWTASGVFKLEIEFGAGVQTLVVRPSTTTMTIPNVLAKKPANLTGRDLRRGVVVSKLLPQQNQFVAFHFIREVHCAWARQASEMGRSARSLRPSLGSESPVSRVCGRILNDPRGSSQQVVEVPHGFSQAPQSRAPHVRPDQPCYQTED